MPFPLTERVVGLFEKAGADRTIRRALITRLWSVLAGPIGILMAARFLSKEEQGFLYAFASLQGLQIFFELGLTFIIMQFASHEKGHLEWTDSGTLEGQPRAKQRLSSILRLSVFWYSTIASLLAISLPLMGLWFFSSTPTQVQWLIPWLLAAFTTACTIIFVPIYGILEGCGKLADVYGLNLIQTITSTLAFWVALALGGGLYSPTVQWFVATAIGATWLYFNFRPFFLDLWRCTVLCENRVSWKHEMWPLQWKISLSWASGYFLFQLATPLIFRTLGPVTAGQFGMTLKMATTIQTIGQTWISTKAATYGTLYSRKEWHHIRRIFLKSLIMSGIIIALMSLAFLAGLSSLPLLGFDALAERFLSVPLSAAMCLNITIYIPIYAIAILARAEKKEPFVWCSIIAAASTASLYILAAPRLGVVGFILSTLAVNLLLVLPWSIIIIKDVITRHSIPTSQAE